MYRGPCKILQECSCRVVLIQYQMVVVKVNVHVAEDLPSAPDVPVSPVCSPLRVSAQIRLVQCCQVTRLFFKLVFWLHNTLVSTNSLPEARAARLSSDSETFQRLPFSNHH